MSHSSPNNNSSSSTPQKQKPWTWSDKPIYTSPPRDTFRPQTYDEYMNKPCSIDQSSFREFAVPSGSASHGGVSSGKYHYHSENVGDYAAGYGKSSASGYDSRYANSSSVHNSRYTNSTGAADNQYVHSNNNHNNPYETPAYPTIWKETNTRVSSSDTTKKFGAIGDQAGYNSGSGQGGGIYRYGYEYGGDERVKSDLNPEAKSFYTGRR